jgi:KDO2-lipid IV(A) lauroyltransferase
VNVYRLLKRIKNSLIYFTVLFFVRLLRSLSRVTAIRTMRLMGGLAFLVARKERQKTVRHLTWAYGKNRSPDEIRRLAKSVFLHFSTAAADAIRIPVIIRNDIDRLITAEGLNHLETAVAEGKGVILITGHFGNWELLGTWLAQKGYPLKVIGKSAYDPRLDKIIVETRNKAGYFNIARGKATREILRCLRKGQLIGMLIDQDTSVEGVFVRFFGRWAHTATGPVVLAKKFSCPVVPIFIRLRKDLTYRIECQSAIALSRTGEEEKDIQTDTQKCSDAIEQIIRRYPAQWVWMHERWKKQKSRI